MNWLIFLAGIFVGVVLEWLFDWFYWRKQRVKWAEKEAVLRADADTARAETDTLRAEVATVQAEIDTLRAGAVTTQAETDALRGELATARAETDAARSEVSTVRAEADSLRSELTASEDRALQLAMALEPRDDLSIIEGIGPKIADLLDGHEIRTFAVLAETSVERLRAILDEGGPRFRLSDPTSWPRQARMAANRDWVRLQQLKQQLRGGVRMPSEPTPPEPQQVPVDDLTIIEGIGEKIAELLNRNGITTFVQLAGASEEQLRAILQGGGPSFQMADPRTWPQQAQLAADRDWERLQQLKERLSAGVRKPARRKPPAPQPAPADDLTIIEGIGEKIAELLNRNGITTFVQLAGTSEEQLRAILQEAGPSFQLADPHTWPRQAQLAADRDWVRLQTVKENLTGGVRRPAAAEPGPSEADGAGRP